MLAVVVACVAAFWKELLIGAFDPELADSMRLSPLAMHDLLMVLVSFTAVTAFEAVGSILVVAMLIAPGAAAQLLVDRMRSMLGVAVLLALAATIGGYALAWFVRRAWNDGEA